MIWWRALCRHDHLNPPLLAAGGGAFGDVGLHPQLAGGDGSAEPVLLLLHRSQTLVGLHEVRYRHGETPPICRRCSPYWDAHPRQRFPKSAPGDAVRKPR